MGWLGQVGGGSVVVVPIEVVVVQQMLFDVVPAGEGGVNALAARGLLSGRGGVEAVPAVAGDDVTALVTLPGEERGAVRGVEAFAFFAVEGGVAAANAPMLVFKGEDVAVVVVVACACGGGVFRVICGFGIGRGGRRRLVVRLFCGCCRARWHGSRRWWLQSGIHARVRGRFR